MKPNSRCALFLLLSFLAGCAGCPIDPFGDGDDRLVIVSYNCQNLFDDVDQGGEYPEYDPSSGEWNNESYLGKLSALAAAIQKIPGDPDVLLLQEVENTSTLERLCRDFLPLGEYDFYAAPPACGAAVQTGIVSRIPVEKLLVHRPGGSETERNILEVWLNPQCKKRSEKIVLINNHWKSRLGGVEASEYQRIRAAQLMKRRVEELAGNFPGLNILLAGDFNEDPWEPGREYPVALGSNEGSGQSPVILAGSGADEAISGSESGTALSLHAFWSNTSAEGSYYYGGAWEKIDHFFWNHELSDDSGWDIVECVLVDDSLLLDEYGTPRAYNGTSLTGYSDHLPLCVVLKHW